MPGPPSRTLMVSPASSAVAVTVTETAPAVAGVVFDAIRALMKQPEPTKRSIGFRSD